MGKKKEGKGKRKTGQQRRLPGEIQETGASNGQNNTSEKKTNQNIIM